MGQGNVSFWIVAALVVGVVLTGILGAKPPLRVVEELDLPRYLGTWYAVASIPTTFERDCAQGTTATYTLLPNGQVEVVNACFSSDGQRIEARGRAWVPDPQVPAKLKVSFVNFLGLRFFPADYWVIDLAPDYSYAVVGHPSRSYGWILSRTPTPTLPADTLAGIRERLEVQGYTWSQFRMIPPGIHAQP
ncbi:MAG TPA: lipocalin family protein [Candidatus Bipolaricaulis sp.]|nr:lipocalin family protein [Candidatus Bipolaricaulis sp.]HRS14245.1 lipocalin family protein [Candidatus Bipolaricaulis sp.]HRU21682.1 lipocalin family protein [Candidatus Bipolaricaulis sp.]